MPSLQHVPVIDSHTGGEPTRVVMDNGPTLGEGALSQRLTRFRQHHDEFRSTVVNEPRGSDAMVGALLCTPVDTSCVAGVIFFNNVGYLGMCVHGTIGVVATLYHAGQITPGLHRIETPVGVVTVQLDPDGVVTVQNVISFRHAANMTVKLDDGQCVTGDVAWGGNWFFLVDNYTRPLRLCDVEALTNFARKIRRALQQNGITGADNAEIDHIELFGPPDTAGAHSRNFVLCPGGAYDRSPCGTGTSAKLACLAAEGKLAPGQWWRQEGILGSIFEGSYLIAPGGIAPSIRGTAHITAEAKLILDPRDPFRQGIRGQTPIST